MHHHYELEGWPETKVTARFWLASLVCSQPSVGNRSVTDSFQLNAGSALLVIGLGRSGLASLEVLARSDVRLFATDEKPPETLSEAIAAAESFGAQFVEPPALPEILGRIDWAVLSPGVPPISPVVRAVHGANVPVIGEIELAYRSSAKRR